MAHTVTVNLSTATAKIGQTVPGQVSVASTDTVPVGVTGISIYPTAINASLMVTQPDLRAGSGAGLGATGAVIPTIINPSGSLSFPFTAVASQPAVPGSTAIAYVLNAVVYFSDGTNTTGNATLTVSPLM